MLPVACPAALAREGAVGYAGVGYVAVCPLLTVVMVAVTITLNQAGQGRVWPDAALSGLIQRDRDGHHDHGEQRAHSHIADAGIADRALPGQGRWAGHGEHSQQVTR